MLRLVCILEYSFCFKLSLSTNVFEIIVNFCATILTSLALLNLKCWYTFTTGTEQNPPEFESIALHQKFTCLIVTTKSSVIL